jgi:ABC-2 type transport system ATP-binding protein
MTRAIDPDDDPPSEAPSPVAAYVHVPPVRIEGVSAGYGRQHVVTGLSLSLGQGDVYALLGRNGSGKTTIVASLMGFRPVTAGSIRVLGLDPWRHRARLMLDVGFVPENPNAPPDATVERIARFCAALHPSWDVAGFAERLRRFSIPARKRFGELSRGQKGLVQMALALAPSPKLLILDDPTLGFDAVAKASFYEELIGELADRGVSVFLTTHDLTEVERIADRVGILHGGRIALEGSPEELKRAHAERQGLGPGATVTLEELIRDLTEARGAAS